MNADSQWTATQMLPTLDIQRLKKALGVFIGNIYSEKISESSCAFTAAYVKSHSICFHSFSAWEKGGKAYFGSFTESPPPSCGAVFYIEEGLHEVF